MGHHPPHTSVKYFPVVSSGDINIFTLLFVLRELSAVPDCPEYFSLNNTIKSSVVFAPLLLTCTPVTSAVGKLSAKEGVDLAKKVPPPRSGTARIQRQKMPQSSVVTFSSFYSLFKIFSEISCFIISDKDIFNIILSFP